MAGTAARFRTIVIPGSPGIQAIVIPGSPGIQAIVIPGSPGIQDKPRASGVFHFRLSSSASARRAIAFTRAPKRKR